MPVQPISLHAIRSNNQRALAMHWNMLAAGRVFPAIDEFRPQATEHPEQMIVWDVEPAEENGYRCRLRSAGLRAQEAFANGMVGKTMEELVPPVLRAVTFEGTRQCVTSGCAIYEIITTVDANAHQVDCERLLLPFGSGERVNQILASLQLISFQGAVDRQVIARDFEQRPQVTFSGRIPSDEMTRRGGGFVSAPPLQPTQAAGATMPVRVLQEAGTPVEREPPRQGREKRKSTRRFVLKAGRISFGKSSENCTVRDISAEGASIECANATNVPDRFSLTLEMESAARKCVVTWRKERQLGVRFE